MASTEPKAHQKSAEYAPRNNITVITPKRDIFVGLIFLLVAFARVLPPFMQTTPTMTGLVWITFIGAYGLYRVVRGIIKFGKY